MASSTGSMLQRGSQSARHCRRTFTSSAARRAHGPLAVFPKTSSEELDAFIDNWRSNIFMPSRLSPLHKKLVYNQKQWHHLTGEESVTVSIKVHGPEEKEDFVLKPLSTVKDEQRVSTGVRELLRLVQDDPSDYSGLLSFLRELGTARPKAAQRVAPSVVRELASRGKMDFVMKLLAQSDKTQFKIGHPRLAAEVMRGALKHAMMDNWSEAALDKALKHAQIAMAMMLDPKHATKHVKASPFYKMKPINCAENWAIGLSLSSTNAVKYQGCKDEPAVVTKYAAGLLKNMNDEDVSINEAEETDLNFKVTRWAPAWHGIEMALRVVGDNSEIGKRLKVLLQERIGPLLAKGVPQLRAREELLKLPRGLYLYEELGKVL